MGGWWCILRRIFWSRWGQEERWSWRVPQWGAGHLENRGRGELRKGHHLWKERRKGETFQLHLCTTKLFSLLISPLTLSLLAPGLERSWSECCWFQLEPVGPDMLRPTPGYAPIWLDRPTWVRWWSCAPGGQWNQSADTTLVNHQPVWKQTEYRQSHVRFVTFGFIVRVMRKKMPRPTLTNLIYSLWVFTHNMILFRNLERMIILSFLNC